MPLVLSQQCRCSRFPCYAMWIGRLNVSETPRSHNPCPLIACPHSRSPSVNAGMKTLSCSPQITVVFQLSCVLHAVIQSVKTINKSLVRFANDEPSSRSLHPLRSTLRHGGDAGYPTALLVVNKLSFLLLFCDCFLPVCVCYCGIGRRCSSGTPRSRRPSRSEHLKLLGHGVTRTAHCYDAQ